jgi:16S rRNA processing protein RimM
MVARPHGLRGEVIVELWTNRTERLVAGSRLWTRADPPASGQERELTVAAATPHHNRWIVWFAGVTDRSGAEALRDAVLEAPPVADPDSLWVHELIGADLLDTTGRRRGRIVAVEANPASDLLVLEDGGLVPLRFVVDSRPGAVTAEIPEGLLG